MGLFGASLSGASLSGASLSGVGLSVSGRRSMQSVLVLGGASGVRGSAIGTAGGAARGLDGDGEADPDEGAPAGGIGEPRDDADDLAVTVEQRTTGAARVHRGVELDQAALLTLPVLEFD